MADQPPTTSNPPATPENPPIMTKWYLDKALWVGVLTPLLLLVNSKFGTALDAGTIAGIVLPVVAYIVGTKWSSTKKALAVYSANAPTRINQ